MTRALRAILDSGVWHEVREYAPDPASASFGLGAAAALGVPPERVFKTLVARADRTTVVVLVPVSREVDFRALAAALGAKRAQMVDPAEAERVTGYVTGGISPIAQKRGHPTVVDASVAALDVVWVSGGRRGLELGLRPADLLRLTGATTAPIAR
jgi:Cys-tRNA(Pro)/Cys-tRNA(Cys) deacylase